MAWVVSNPYIFVSFASGTFEATFVSSHYYLYPLEAVNAAVAFSRSSTEKHAGTYSLRSVAQNGAYGIGEVGETDEYRKPLFRLRPYTAVTKDKRYTVKGWVKVTAKGGAAAGPVDKVVLQASFLNSGKVNILDINEAFTDGDWQEFEFSVIASASQSVVDLVFVEFQLYCLQVGVGLPFEGITFYLDDMEVIEETNVTDPLTATYTKTDVTANGASDGTISVTPAGGLAPYSYLWNDASTAQNRTGLPAGSYTVTVSDSDGGEVELAIQITEPGVEPTPVGDFIFVPAIQSLRFIKKAEVNNCSVMETHDNTLLCDQRYGRPFYQPVAKCDIFPLQFQSNYPDHEVKLYKYNPDMEEVKTFDVQLKQQLAGVIKTYPITISNDGAGKSRVYFNVGGIPLPLEAGDVFEILNNADGLNGNYAIVSIQNDIALGTQYLVITLNYTLPTPSSAAVGAFSESVVNFNIYEFVLNLGDVADGFYFMTIGGKNPTDEDFDIWTSEPINLRTSHKNMHLIEARCFDNAFDVAYTTGITHKWRVLSSFYQAVPGGQDENYRQSNFTPVKLAGRASRKYKFEIFEQPAYRHEMFSVAMRMDVFKVNGVEHFSEDGYGEPTWRARYPFCNSVSIVEQVNWFKDYNGDDLGTVEGETGFLIVNNGYLKVSK